MYLAVDIGGTKTLVAALSASGELVEKTKFPTPQDYQAFLAELAANVAKLSTKNFDSGAVGVPGHINRETGVVYALGNLPWRDMPIRDDISKTLGGLKIIIENDARLAGLAEGVALKGSYSRVLYATVSTGIGGALIEDGAIAKSLQDIEMGKMPLVFEGQVVQWEEFAGGRGVMKRYGKMARDIDDPKTWEEIGANIAYGLGVACTFLQPEVIVLGGGVGQFVDHFQDVVMEYLQANLHANVSQPKALLAAKHKEDGVVYGCYELIQQSLRSPS